MTVVLRNNANALIDYLELFINVIFCLPPNEFESCLIGTT
jgi:hypothetical protein